MNLRQINTLKHRSDFFSRPIRWALSLSMIAQVLSNSSVCLAQNNRKISPNIVRANEGVLNVKAVTTKIKISPIKAKIYVALSIHVEGSNECKSVKDLGRSPTVADCNSTKYEQHFSNLQNLGAIFINTRSGIALPLSLELEEQFLSAAKVFNEGSFLGARLDSLVASGHSLGPHADAFAYHESDTSKGMKNHFTYLRDTLLDPKVQRSITASTTLSGVCSTGDWLKVTESLGFNNISGLVSFCLRSLPEESIPQNDIPSATLSDSIESACNNPSACHATYPYLYYDSSTEKFDISRGTHPWRTDSKFHWMGGPGASLWTASVTSGTTAILPGVGALYCLAEKKGATYRWESETNCDFCQDDIDTYFEILDQTIAEATLLTPKLVHSVYSLGHSVDTVEKGCATPTIRRTLLNDFVTRMQRDYVDTGKVQWKTAPEFGELVP
jgi:hypothetical protein